MHCELKLGLAVLFNPFVSHQFPMQWITQYPNTLEYCMLMKKMKRITGENSALWNELIIIPTRHLSWKAISYKQSKETEGFLWLELYGKQNKAVCKACVYVIKITENTNKKRETSTTPDFRVWELLFSAEQSSVGGN